MGGQPKTGGDRNGYVLVMGQVPSDNSLRGAWGPTGPKLASLIQSALPEEHVIFRPHPRYRQEWDGPMDTRELYDSIQHAKAVVGVRQL